MVHFVAFICAVTRLKPEKRAFQAILEFPSLSVSAQLLPIAFGGDLLQEGSRAHFQFVTFR